MFIANSSLNVTYFPKHVCNCIVHITSHKVSVSNTLHALTRPQSSLIICTRSRIGSGRGISRHLGEGEDHPARISYALPSLIIKRDKGDDWGRVRFTPGSIKFMWFTNAHKFLIITPLKLKNGAGTCCCFHSVV